MKKGGKKKREVLPLQPKGPYGGAREGAGRDRADPVKKRQKIVNFKLSKHHDATKFKAAGYRLLYTGDPLFEYIKRMPHETIETVARKMRRSLSVVENYCSLLGITINKDRTTKVEPIDSVLKPTDIFGRLEPDAAKGDDDD